MNKLVSKIGEELREAIPLTIFFLVIFHMVAISKSVVLEEYSITPTGSAIASVGALLVAKAILVARRLPFTRALAHRPLFYDALWQTTIFAGFTLLFRLIEEFIPLIARHQGVAAAARNLYREIRWPEFWVIQMWLFASLLLYCIASELARATGARSAAGMLFAPKPARLAPSRVRLTG
jgi:hypothetical protein